MVKVFLVVVILCICNIFVFFCVVISVVVILVVICCLIGWLVIVFSIVFWEILISKGRLLIFVVVNVWKSVKLWLRDLLNLNLGFSIMCWLVILVWWYWLIVEVRKFCILVIMFWYFGVCCIVFGLFCMCMMYMV